jgi:hypothetical protein
MILSRTRHALVATGSSLVFTVASGVTLAPVAAAPAAHHPRPNAVIQWNAYAGEVAIAACLSPTTNPLHESRMYAVVHLAVHDALQAVQKRSAPYFFHGHARGASPRAAVAAAARTSLVGVLDQMAASSEPACISAARGIVRRAYVAATAALPDNERTDRGRAVGRRAGAALVKHRSHDGSDTPLVVADYPQGDDPGEWRFTPEVPFAFAPGWGDVEPFGLANADQFRPEPPYAIRSGAYLRDFRQVKRLGSDGLSHPSARTEDQTETALFWVESSPLSWNRLARTLATRQHLDLWDSARLFGLLNVAMADGYISSFDYKYEHPFWRPVTAIRMAGTDGNPRTRPDRDWTPLAITPPIPDHDSAHAVEGGAAASVFTRFFGTDAMSFDVCSNTLAAGTLCTDAAPTTRHFDSFRDAARENAWSRVLVGFHFWHASQEGLRHGYRIGHWTVRHELRLVRPEA